MQRSTKIALAALVGLMFVVGTTAHSDGGGADGKRAENSRSFARAQATSTPTPRTTRTWRWLSDNENRRERPTSLVLPDLRGRELQDSQNALGRAGFYLFTQRDATKANRRQILDTNWKVCHTRPHAGTRASLDTRIVFYSVKRDENCPPRPR